MAAAVEQEVWVEEIMNFNGPEDDADDVYDDDFELDEIDSIAEFDNFDEDDEY